MAEENLDIRELSRFANSALQSISRRYTRTAEKMTRHIGQLAVKRIKSEMLAHGNAQRQSVIDEAQANSSKRLSAKAKKQLTSGVGLSRKSAIYKAIKRTGTWDTGTRDNPDYNVRTYVSSSVKNDRGQSARDYVWFTEHGNKYTSGKHYTGAAVQKIPNDYTKYIEEEINNLLEEGVHF